MVDTCNSPLRDCTDMQWLEVGFGESISKRMNAIRNTLSRRVEALAGSIAYSRSARTEQGKSFTVYANGQIKLEGEAAAVKIISGDMSADAQIMALQECAEENFAVILADKPLGDDILIWRVEPEIRRALFPDGLHIYIYSRLAWDKLHG